LASRGFFWGATQLISDSSRAAFWLNDLADPLEIPSIERDTESLRICHASSCAHTRSMGGVPGRRFCRRARSRRSHRTGGALVHRSGSVAIGLAAARPDQGVGLGVLVVEEVGVDRSDEARIVQFDREVVAPFGGALRPRGSDLSILHCAVGLKTLSVLPINVYKFTSAEASELSCTSSLAYNFEASLMNCLYNFCFLVFSCASVRAPSFPRYLSQVAIRDVRPPTADPPKAASAGT